MGLTNAQYSEIMRTYDQHQLQNRALHASRMEQAYKSNPRLKEVDELIATCSAGKAKCKV